MPSSSPWRTCWLSAFTGGLSTVSTATRPRRSRLTDWLMAVMRAPREGGWGSAAIIPGSSSGVDSLFGACQDRARVASQPVQGGAIMHRGLRPALVAVVLIVVASLAGAPAAHAQAPRHGGELSFVVGSEMPSYDGHREETFGL